MILFYLLILVMPLTLHPLWARFVGEFTVIKYLGAICFVYALALLCLGRSRPRFLGTWQARWFLLLTGIAAASYFSGSHWRQWSTSPLLSYASFLLLFFIALVVIDSVSRLQRLLVVMISSVALASVFLLREWQKFSGVYPGFRPGFVTGDSDYFTVSALSVLPLALYLALEHRERRLRRFCQISCLLTLVAVTLAASRGGAIGLAAALGFVIWQSRRRWRNLVLAAAVLGPLMIIAPSSPLHRFLNPSGSDQESSDTRKAVWKLGLRMIREHPLAGIGLGNYKALSLSFDSQGELSRARVAHNSYLEIAAEMGLPALAVFLALLGSTYFSLRQVRRTARNGPPILREAAIGLQANLIGYAVGIMFASAQYQKLFWLGVFVSMCLPSIHGLRPAKAPAR